MIRVGTETLAQLFLQPEQATLLTLEQWQTVILVLRHAGLLSQLYGQLSHAEVLDELPDYARRHLANAWVLAEKQHKQVHYEARALAQTLSHYTQYRIFLKGAAYTLAGNKASEGRTYSDLDLLVDRDSLAKAEPVLAIWGWLGQAIDDYDDRYYRQWAHEIPPLQHASRGTVLDLHHNLVPPISGKAPDIHWFTDNSVTIAGRGQVLRPAAMVLHSAIHLFFNEDFKHGFRDIYDLHCLFTDYGSDDFWQDIETLARQTAFTRELYLALRYCQWFFHTPISQQAYRQLAEGLGISRWQRFYWDWVFKRVLLPHHPCIQVRGQGLAISLATVRGHCLKMPPSVLVRHTLTKFWRGMAEAVLGKGYQDEQESTKG